MIGLLAAAWLASVQTADQAPDTAFGQRMRDSAAAAQALQGPLDGRWTLTDAKGHTLYLLEIADPAQGAAPLTAAWSDPRTRALGGVETISRAGDHLRLAFAPDPSGGTVRLSLRRLKGGVWSGRAASQGRERPVRLKRS